MASKKQVPVTALFVPRAGCARRIEGPDDSPHDQEIDHVTIPVRLVPALLAACLLTALPVFAQDDDPDREVNVSQPDFTINTLAIRLGRARARVGVHAVHDQGPHVDAVLVELAGEERGLVDRVALG